MNKCQCMLDDENKCSRTISKKIGDNPILCWQHQNCTNLYITSTIPKDPNNHSIITKTMQISTKRSKLISKTCEIKKVIKPISGGFTGLRDIDILILLNIDFNKYKNVIIDKTTETIIRDQEFWRFLLEKKYDIKVQGKCVLNYEFIIKNATNLTSHLNSKKYEQEIKFLQVNMLLLPDPVMEHFFQTRVSELINNKYKSYDKFIEYIYNLWVTNYKVKFDISYFNTVIYKDKTLELTYLFDKKWKHIILSNEYGFTPGIILFQFAQLLSTELYDGKIFTIDNYNEKIFNNHEHVWIIL